MTLIEIFSIIIIHWIADFIMQSDYDAKNKSKFFHALFSHTITYSLVWFLVGACLVLLNFRFSFWNYEQWDLSLFVLITFVCHTITDYFTSRLNGKLAPKEEVIMLKWDKNQPEQAFIRFPKGRSYHNLFISIGGDQVLHYVQLFLTYQLLK